MLNPWILAFSLVTVAATIWMGFRSARSSKSAADFFVAGRSVSVGWNASAISGEYLSAASFMGVAGMVMSSGYDALWYPVCYACGYLFLLLFIAGPLRRFGAYTIPDFAEGRYDSPVFRKIAVLFVLFIGFFYTMPQMKGAGTTLAYVFKDIEFFGQQGLPYWVGVVVVGAVITLNVALGGMKGITLVQAFQYWMKMFAISVPIFVLASVYGGYGKQLEAARVPQSVGTPSGTTLQASALPGNSVGGLAAADRPAQTIPWHKVTVGRSVAPGLGERLTAWMHSFASRTWGVPVQEGMPLWSLMAQTFPEVYFPGAQSVSIYFSPGLDASKIFIHHPTRTSAQAAPGPRVQIASLLEANGIAFEILDPGVVKVFPASEASRFAGGGYDRVESSPNVPGRNREIPVTANELSACLAKAMGGSAPLAPFGIGDVFSQPDSVAPRMRFASGMKPYEWATTNATLRELALYFARCSDRHIWLATEFGAPLQDVQLGPFDSANYWGRKAASNAIRQRLFEAGFRIYPMSRNQIALLEASDHQKAVQALGVFGSTAQTGAASSPAKAPSSSSWLNPFGPLTTKAARAALATRATDAELIAASPEMAGPMQVLGRTIYPNNFAGLLARIRNAFRKPPPIPWRTMIGGGSSNVMAHLPAPLAVYAAVIGKPVAWDTNLAAMGPFLMDVNYTGATTDLEFAAKISRQLADQGIALVDSPRGMVYAVNAEQLRILRSAYPAPNEASLRPYALLYTYSLIIALVCGTAGLPHILVRFYTNPDGVAAKRTTLWVMILIGIFYVFPPVFGVMGRNLMPALYDGSGVNGTDGIVLKLPTVLGDRFGPLGSILSGITCAGAFAAFMSTFSGLLVSMTGALAHDVYGRILRPQSTPEQRLRMFKFAAILIGAIAILLGTLVENFEINFMVGQAFAIAAASYFPLLFMSVWWRGMTVRGAATGMLSGGLLAVAAISLTSWTTFLTTQAAKFKALGRPEPAWFAALKPYSLSEFWAAHPLLRILGEQPALWAVPLAILLMIVVSRLTRHTVPGDIRQKMLVLHAPEALGLRQDYIRDHEAAH